MKATWVVWTHPPLMGLVRVVFLHVWWGFLKGLRGAGFILNIGKLPAIYLHGSYAYATDI